MKDGTGKDILRNPTYFDGEKLEKYRQKSEKFFQEVTTETHLHAGYFQPGKKENQQYSTETCDKLERTEDSIPFAIFLTRTSPQ